MNGFKDGWERDFDKKAKRITGAFIGVWAFGVLVTLVFWILVIWGLFEGIQWLRAN